MLSLRITWKRNPNPGLRVSISAIRPSEVIVLDRSTLDDAPAELPADRHPHGQHPDDAIAFVKRAKLFRTADFRGIL